MQLVANKIVSNKHKNMKTTEEIRLDNRNNNTENWSLWGPYLSERQWGTVREDYSKGGDAWDYLTHDHARSRAFRWNERLRPQTPTDLTRGLHPAIPRRQ